MKKSFLLGKCIKGLLSMLISLMFLCVVLQGALLMGDSIFPIYEHPFWFSMVIVALLFIVVLLVSEVSGRVSSKRDRMSFLEGLATFPGKKNYNWQGGYSLLSFVILHLVTVLRAVSCLQLCKYLYRRFNKTDKDAASNRINVPPLLQETYFLLWIAFLIVQVQTGISCKLIFSLDTYFVIESLTWIMYYSVFRRFFEENYSIYHVLEHFTLILLLIPFQAIAYSKVVSFSTPDLDWKDLFLVLLGQADKNRILFTCIGFFYTAIVISMVLSLFPNEKVKRGNPKTSIIGAGDVVKNRLLPSILKREEHLSGNKRTPIEIYDINDGDVISGWDCVGKTWINLGYSRQEKTRSIFSLVLSNKSSEEEIAWICTPSDSHWYYLETLQDRFDYLAVEKPLTSRADELERFKDYAQDSKREKTFFLSYYLLEKGLPMTFLCRPQRLYLKYLAGYDAEGNQITDENESQSMIEKCFKVFLQGGTVKSFSMSIIETEDTRNLPPGGQLIDTFVHHCLMASLWAGLPSKWTNVHFKCRQEDRIEMYARGKERMSIQLFLKKGNSGESEQSAEVEMENPKIKTSIIADFEKKRVTIHRDNETFSFGVSEQYMGKYNVQCSMVYDCFENDIKSSEVDGLYNQIEVLEWLFGLMM